MIDVISQIPIEKGNQVIPGEVISHRAAKATTVMKEVIEIKVVITALKKNMVEIMEIIRGTTIMGMAVNIIR